ncbi:MAG TPA: hypothetical protein ENJ95_13695 [Bacteroidetes bacterium]|nr:hypothetical protein [Bacteroidota bacterium]
MNSGRFLVSVNLVQCILVEYILNHNRFCAFAIAHPQPLKGSISPQCTKPIMVQYSCNKNLTAVRNIGRALIQEGIAENYLSL